MNLGTLLYTWRTVIANNLKIVIHSRFMTSKKQVYFEILYMAFV